MFAWILRLFRSRFVHNGNVLEIEKAKSWCDALLVTSICDENIAHENAFSSHGRMLPTTPSSSLSILSQGKAFFCFFLFSISKKEREASAKDGGLFDSL